MTSANRRYSPEMVAYPNRFTESEPLLRTRVHQTECEGYDINTKICGLHLDGPDSIRAYWVAFSAFFISFITAGIGRVSGILLPHLLTEFGIDREMASVPFSVQLALRNLLGPIVGVLGHKFGVRKITLLGVVILAFSTALCCSTHNYFWVIVYWGYFSGVGIALCTSLLQLTVGQYFERNKATAMGFSLAGGCLGSITLPSIVELLLQLFPLKYVFLCMGIMISTTVFFAWSLKEPPWLNAQNQPSENYDQLDTVRAMVSLENSLQMLQVKDFSQQSHSAGLGIIKTFVINMPNITFLRKHKELIIKLLRRGTQKTFEKDKYRLETSIRNSMEDLFQYIDRFLKNLTEKNFMNQSIFVSSETNPAVTGQEISLIDIVDSSNKSTRNSITMKLEKISLMTLSEIMALCPNENKHDILKISKEIRNLCSIATRLEKQENGLLLSKSTVQDIQIQNEEPNIFNSKCHHLSLLRIFLIQCVWNHLKPVIILYRNPLFLLISICRLIHFIIFVPVLVIIVDFMMEKGLPELDGQYGIISLSVGDFIGRMFTGWVTDKGFLSLPNFMAIIMLLQCASTVTLPLIYNRNMMLVALSIFGLLQGSNFVRHPVLISNYMDKEEQPFAMGCLSFFSGIFACILPYYVGLSKDTLGTYDFLFYLSGPIGACTGFIWFLVPKFERFYCTEKTTTELDEPV
ncbi:uncharacterized protein LOC129964054 [Argiope bruennichi]|uniref:uncharacterized protein LOC129964054 n=1 Tax=Argiope bruennichi TaxID=94029 RepID=UPI0024958AC5|nr:uncharacterized protein LOC129964054 [Argiope bruennichi]XP_055934700.1 uncharacterized protein LOC129964054 [Argiope bruennichi]XP_055934701.1 uncharacterized protein LOC129964054 [Argiope bruennichi]